MKIPSVRGWILSRMRALSADDILAINPNFVMSVNEAEEASTKAKEAADSLRKEAESKLASALLREEQANRKLDAIKKFRTATGGR